MLTKEQQDFIAEHYEKGIIHGFFYHHQNLNEDDYHDLACIGLCKCVPNYNKEKGKFSTFAYKYMLNEILQYIQGQNTQKRKIVKQNSSLDYKVSDDTESSELISNGINYKNNTIDEICLNQKMNKLNDKQKNLLNMVLLGFKQREIGELLKISQQAVNLQMNKIKSIIKQEYALESI